VEVAFAIRSSWEADTAVFEVSGEIDLATAPELVSAVDGAVDARRVVVDLSDATFVDSAAINSLIRCRRELGERGIAFRLVSPPDGIVRKALEITNVITELGVVDSRSEALV
jgi:anti-sigma B factor antagonist